MEKENFKENLDTIYEKMEILLQTIENTMELYYRREMKDLLVENPTNEGYFGKNLKIVNQLLKRKKTIIVKLKLKNKSRELKI